MNARRVVVVDGSNLATEGRTVPSLKQLDEAVRAYAEEDPAAEIVVVVDASFEHRIDPSERSQLVEAELHGEIVSPPAGAIGRGDAFVLRIAERTGARVLSNDSFQEFHGEHPWLFDEGRLVGGKPVPGVGWIFTPRIPVRGPKSRAATGKARRAAADDGLSPPVKAAELARAAKKLAARKLPAVMPDGSAPRVGDVWPATGTNGHPTATIVEPAFDAEATVGSDKRDAKRKRAKKPEKTLTHARTADSGSGPVRQTPAKRASAAKAAANAASGAAGAGAGAGVAAKKAAAKKTAAKKTAAKKTAATKTAAKKVAATKVAATKVAATKQTGTKQVAAKKAAGTKQAAATKKAAATKQAAAKKAAGTKQAASKQAPATVGRAPTKQAPTRQAPAKRAAGTKGLATEAGAAQAPIEAARDASLGGEAASVPVPPLRASARGSATKRTTPDADAAGGRRARARAGAAEPAEPVEAAPAPKPAQRSAAKTATGPLTKVAATKTAAKKVAASAKKTAAEKVTDPATSVRATKAHAASSSGSVEEATGPPPSRRAPRSGAAAPGVSESRAIGSTADAPSTRSRRSGRGGALEDPALQQAISQAMAEIISPPAEPEQRTAPGGHSKKQKGDSKSSKRRRRRATTPPPAVNAPLAFITFVATYPLLSEVDGEVVSFTSHGAMVDVGLPEGGLLHCYIPLTAMGDPPPTKARQVLARGERRPFVLVGLDPPRRVAELALPGTQPTIAG